jgi:hypothetical protein
VYTPAPSSRSQAALDLLASWASTPEQTLSDDVSEDR